MASITKSSKPTRAEQLASCPQRSPQATLERRADGTGLVKVPVRSTWLFRAPSGATRSFELDEIGLLVWDSCDGQNSLEQIIKIIADRYRLNLREAEVATLKFLDTLAQKRLIGLAT